MESDADRGPAESGTDESDAEEGPSEPEAEEPLAPSAVETVDNEASADLQGIRNNKIGMSYGDHYSRH